MVQSGTGVYEEKGKGVVRNWIEDEIRNFCPSVNVKYAKSF
jgi:hypothetical protein